MKIHFAVKLPHVYSQTDRWDSFNRQSTGMGTHYKLQGEGIVSGFYQEK
jgi:hypothetical protein